MPQLVLAALMLLSIPPWGDGRSQPEDLEIQLVTFGPGDEITNYFGHNGVVVTDKRLRDTRMYNYGMFGFGPDTLPKFLMGRLIFWAADLSTSQTVAAYRSMNRDIRFQTIYLPPDKRLEFARLLANDVLPENREYLYHHYNTNCATRVRDLLDQVLDGQFKAQNSGAATLDLRQHTRRLTSKNVPLELLLVYWMNDEIDRDVTVWDEMFLPMELEKATARMRFETDGNTVPLVMKTTSIYEARDREPAPAEPPARGWIAILFGLFFGGIAAGVGFWRSRDLDKTAPRIALGLWTLVAGLVIGLPALLLFMMATFTEHGVTYWNENLLLANPVTTAAIPFGVAIALGSTRAFRWMGLAWYALTITSVLAIVLKVLPMFDQANLDSILMLLPVNLGFAAAAWLAGVRPPFMK